MKATLHTDGGARGNPGPSGIGGVLKIEGKEELTFSEYIGEATNNLAEYKALVKGIELALNETVTELVCYLDSELVVKQLKGQYRVKNAGLKPIFEYVKEMKKKFKSVSFNHVLRAKNKAADKLVNEAIDKAVK